MQIILVLLWFCFSLTQAFAQRQEWNVSAGPAWSFIASKHTTYQYNNTEVKNSLLSKGFFSYAGGVELQYEIGRNRKLIGAGRFASQEFGYMLFKTAPEFFAASKGWTLRSNSIALALAWGMTIPHRGNSYTFCAGLAGGYSFSKVVTVLEEELSTRMDATYIFKLVENWDNTKLICAPELSIGIRRGQWEAGILYSYNLVPLKMAYSSEIDFHSYYPVSHLIIQTTNGMVRSNPSMLQLQLKRYIQRQKRS